MHASIVSISLTFVAQSHAKEAPAHLQVVNHHTNLHDAVDNVVDNLVVNLFQRALRVWALHCTDLDLTILAMTRVPVDKIRIPFPLSRSPFPGLHFLSPLPVAQLPLPFPRSLPVMREVPVHAENRHHDVEDAAHPAEPVAQETGAFTAEDEAAEAAEEAASARRISAGLANRAKMANKAVEAAALRTHKARKAAIDASETWLMLKDDARHKAEIKSKIVVSKSNRPGKGGTKRRKVVGAMIAREAAKKAQVQAKAKEREAKVEEDKLRAAKEVAAQLAKESKTAKDLVLQLESKTELDEVRAAQKASTKVGGAMVAEEAATNAQGQAREKEREAKVEEDKLEAAKKVGTQSEKSKELVLKLESKTELDEVRAAQKASTKVGGAMVAKETGQKAQGQAREKEREAKVAEDKLAAAKKVAAQLAKKSEKSKEMAFKLESRTELDEVRAAQKAQGQARATKRGAKVEEDAAAKEVAAQLAKESEQSKELAFKLESKTEVDEVRAKQKASTTASSANAKSHGNSIPYEERTLARIANLGWTLPKDTLLERANQVLRDAGVQQNTFESLKAITGKTGFGSTVELNFMTPDALEAARLAIRSLNVQFSEGRSVKLDVYRGVLLKSIDI